MTVKSRPGEPTGDTLIIAYRDQRRLVDMWVAKYHALAEAATSFLVVDADIAAGDWDARFDALAIALDLKVRASDCPYCQETTK